MNTFFIIYKGQRGKLHKTELPLALKVFLWIIFGGLITIPFIPRLRNKINQLYDEGKIVNISNKVTDEHEIENATSSDTVSDNEVLIQYQNPNLMILKLIKYMKQQKNLT